MCENLRMQVAKRQWISVDAKKGRMLAPASRHNKLGTQATLGWGKEDIGSLQEKGAHGLVAERE